MSFPVSPLLLVVFVGVIFLAGAINGLAGFGFALVGTMALATVVDPAVAVVFLILPILAVNLSLVSELSSKQLRVCGKRFAPLLLSALIGALLGMVLIDFLPADPLRIVLGLVSLGFVLSAQQFVSVPGLARVRDGCFVETTPAMIGVGGVAGVLFGGTNVGVQLVAYVRSCDLSHGLFVGVVAMVFLGLNSIRVAAAGILGLYPDLTIVVLSVGASIPAVLGVVVGAKFRPHVSTRTRRGIVLVLLAGIGIRLILGGAGIV